MHILTHLLTWSLALTLLTACTRAAHSDTGGQLSARPLDPDAVALATLGRQAAQRARQVTPDVILRQVDMDRRTTIFRFTDRAAAQEIMVQIGAPGGPADQWSTSVTAISPLVGHVAPDLDLQQLHVGPDRAAKAIATHWSACTRWTLTLYRDANDLLWRAFCETPQGVVAGTMNNRTGVFQPEVRAPAQMPPTAPPRP